MKKIIVALTMLVSTSAFAGYDSNKCDLYTSGDQDVVEAMIVKDVLNNTPSAKRVIVSKALKSGDVFGLGYVLYCDKHFDNSQIATEVTGQ